MTAAKPPAKLRVIHLLDDFGMGGVVRALSVFQEPELTAFSASEIIPVAANTRVAPHLPADIIITHFPPSWSRLSFFVSLRLRNPSAKLIHVEHSYTRSFEQLHVSSKFRFRSLLKLAFGMFDHIVGVSNAQTDWLQEITHRSADNIHAIYPWSGRDELRKLAPPKRDDHHPLRLASYGRFDAIKNFVPLIDAVSAIGPAVELHLAGSGPEEAALIARSNMAENVHMHGHIDDIGAFLSQADAVIVPSLRESYGLVATEARLAARPIIVADVDGLPEQVGSSGLVAPCRTADEITQAICQFMTLPFGAMSTAARRGSIGIRSATLSRWTELLSL